MGPSSHHERKMSHQECAERELTGPSWSPTHQYQLAHSSIERRRTIATTYSLNSIIKFKFDIMSILITIIKINFIIINPAVLT